MNIEEEHSKCEDQILADYNKIKEGLDKEDVVICKHLGTFNQHILISIISLVDHALVQNGESLNVQKRLSYLVIECIHNIINHSNLKSDKNQLAFLLLVKNKSGYTIYSSNALETINISSLEKKLDELLVQKKNVLTNLFKKKIETPEINEKGFGGLGLLTIIDKTGKDFKYKITKVTENFSLFHIELDVKYKNYE